MIKLLEKVSKCKLYQFFMIFKVLFKLRFIEQILHTYYYYVVENFALFVFNVI